MLIYIYKGIDYLLKLQTLEVDLEDIVSRLDSYLLEKNMILMLIFRKEV